MLNNNLKYGLFFLGGVALGAIGAVAVSRGKLDLKPLATDLISRGLEVKDAVLAGLLPLNTGSVCLVLNLVHVSLIFHIHNGLKQK